MICLFAKQFIFIVCFVLAGYITGVGFVKKLPLYLAERCVFSIVLGWGIIGFLMMLLGFLGWLRPHILFVAITTLLMVSSLRAAHKCHPIKNSKVFLKKITQHKFYSVITIFIMFYFLLSFYSSLYPVTEFDAVMYHLPTAKEFLRHGNIGLLLSLRFPVSPQLIDLFWIFPILFGNTIFANMISYAMSSALLISIYSFGQRFFSREVGLFSAVIFLSSPIVLKFSVVPYVDIGTALFCFLAFYGLCLYFSEKKPSFCLISGFLWGLSLGAKYYSILFMLAALLSISVFLIRKKSELYYMTLLVLIASLIALPWYIRNKLYTGDLFFPFLAHKTAIANIWGVKEAIRHIRYMSSFGLGKSINSLLMLPVNLLYHSDRFQGPIGFFMIIWIASVFFIKRSSRWLKIPLLISVFYVLGWFYSFQVTRYLFPVLPLFSLMSGWTLESAILRFRLKRQAIEFFVAFIILLFGLTNYIKIIKNNCLPPVTKIQEFEYLAKKIPTYKAISFLNNIEQNGASIVYALFDEGATFYHRNRVIGDWFGIYGYRTVFKYLKDPVILNNILKRYGAHYFLVKIEESSRESIKHLDSNLDGKGFKVIYKDDNSVVFKIL